MNHQFLCKNCQEPLTSVTYAEGKMRLQCNNCGGFLLVPVTIEGETMQADRATRDHIKCLGE